MTHDFHVATAYLRLLNQAEQDLMEETLDHLGLSRQELSDNEYLSGELVIKLFNLFHQKGLHSWAVKYGNHLNVGSHGPLGFAALSAPTLESALEVLVEYHLIRSSAYRCHLSVDNNRLQFHYYSLCNDELTSRWLIESAMDVVKALIETIVAHPIGDNTMISFTHDRPEQSEELDMIFNTQCHYNAPTNTFSIPASWSKIPSPLYDEAVFRTNLAKCRELKLALQTDQSDAVKQVTERLENHFDLMVAGQQTQTPLPSLEQIAENLHISARTLIRRLKKENTSYKKLLENTRREQASRLLKNTHLTVADIAYMLGYQEPANFGRAFKAWFGRAPTLWRREG